MYRVVFLRSSLMMRSGILFTDDMKLLAEKEHTKATKIHQRPTMISMPLLSMFGQLMCKYITQAFNKG